MVSVLVFFLLLGMIIIIGFVEIFGISFRDINNFYVKDVIMEL